MDEFLSRNARAVLLPDRRCTANNKDGERCGRSAALGAFTCDKHGAKSPLSIKAAHERLAVLAEPASDVLFRATRTAPPCPVCERSDADRDPTAVRAAIAILDRFGVGPHASLTVQPAPSYESHGLDDDAMIQLVEQKLHRVEQQLAVLRQNRDARLLPEAAEGYIVGDDEPDSTRAIPDRDSNLMPYSKSYIWQLRARRERERRSERQAAENGE